MNSRAAVISQDVFGIVQNSLEIGVVSDLRTPSRPPAPALTLHEPIPMPCRPALPGRSAVVPELRVPTVQQGE